MSEKKPKVPNRHVFIGNIPYGTQHMSQSIFDEDDPVITCYRPYRGADHGYLQFYWAGLELSNGI